MTFNEFLVQENPLDTNQDVAKQLESARDLKPAVIAQNKPAAPAPRVITSYLSTLFI